MQDLDLPHNASYHNQLATQYHSLHLNDIEIPIDPMLAGPIIDPAILAEDNKVETLDTPLIPHQLDEPQPYSEPLRQYSQGPQGDPFAPPPPPYLPIAIEQSPPPLKTGMKKKRKTRKPDHCGTCDGNDMKNKNKVPELMVTCIECGRREHPSCISAEVVADVVRSYQWRCSECKICEVCLNKGDEAKMVFCDHCDRGWHQDCLDPPLEETPKGKWHCPECPRLDAESLITNNEEESVKIPKDQPVEFDESIRASSVASSSRQKSMAPMSLFTEESEVEVTSSPTKRPTKKTYKKRPPPVKEESVVSSDQEAPPPPVRQPRTKRQRIQSPDRPLPRVRLRLTVQKGKGKEREAPESPKGMFDDILSVEDRDTSKTAIMAWDKQQFERSRQIAEEKLVPPPPPPDVPATPVAGPSRPLRSATLQQISIPTPSILPASPSPSTPGAKVPAFPSMNPDSLRIRTIRFGQYDIKTWYDAPFPEEYASIPDGRLWICEFCLKYMKSRLTAGRHKLKCKARHPPGDEIYRDGSISIFEVDGRKNKIYCQNLCLLSKMFLDHKSLFYDVEPFLFYVITETDEFGARFVGYFSKEKRCSKDYNLSCIMTLPVRQRQGWGNLLIDFSYLLSKKEKRAGSPEKPLSALGSIGYRNYWTLAVMRFLDTATDDLRLEDISNGTSMTIEDVFNTLVLQNMITVRETTPPPVRPSPGQSIKFPKGRRGAIPRRALQRTQTQDDDVSKGPFVPPKSYRIHWDRDTVSLYLRNWEAKGYLRLKPEKLKWTPFLISRAEKQSLTTSGGNSPQEQGERESNSRPRGESSTSGQAESPTSTGQRVDVEETLPVFSPPSGASGSKDPSVSVDTGPPPQSPSGSPMPPILSRRRTRSQNTPSPATGTPSVSLPSRIRPSRSTSRIVLSPQPADTFADDEALAAQLQDEEQHPKRQLRSRQNSSQGIQRLSSTPLRTVPHKRKRIESPPEEDHEIAGDPAPLAQSTTSVNGHHKPELKTDIPSPSLAPQEIFPNVSNGIRLLPAGLPVNLPEHQSIPCTPSEYDIAALLVSMTNSTPVVVHESAPITARTHGFDVRSEDGTTPLTSATSRPISPTQDPMHPLFTNLVSPNGRQINGDQTSGPIYASAPSTMVSKTSMQIYDMAVDDVHHSPIPTDPIKAKDMTFAQSIHNGLNGSLQEEYGDEDADGEYEEDAEGELDDELFGVADSADKTL